MCFRDKAASAGVSLTGATRRVEPSSVGMLATPPLPPPHGYEAKARPRCAGLIIRAAAPCASRSGTDSWRIATRERHRAIRRVKRNRKFSIRSKSRDNSLILPNRFYPCRCFIIDRSGNSTARSSTPSLQFESITRKSVISTRDTNGRRWAKKVFTRFFFRFSLFQVCRVEL